MDKKKVATTRSTSDGAEQASAHSNDAVERHRMDMPMVQNVLLIWLDHNIDDNTASCRSTTTELQRVVHTIKIFTDSEECIQFTESMLHERICMIIPGYSGQHIMPRIHNMSQVDSIFIFSGNKNRHEQWTKEWPKIKGVFTEIAPICEALKKAAQRYEQDAMPMSFMATGGGESKQNLDQLDPSFMYTTIMKEILLTIEFKEQHFMEFVHHCRKAFAGNEVELENVGQFERKYRNGNETPIWWYTYPCFLYPMLNRALRLMDADIIIKMGFFISDLHRHIEQLHKKQFPDQQSHESFTVYRGQGMSKVDFEKLTETQGGLLAFNNFLSTSKDPKVSLGFAYDSLSNPDLVRILFVMLIDPSKSTTPFASVTDISYFEKNEEEVLFAMHSVFRIGDITPMAEHHRLFQVELTLTSDNDQDLRVLTDRIREETFPDNEGWYRLGLVLLKMGQSEKAQQVYELLLEQKTEESEKAGIYHQLGWVKDVQGEYQEAITFYEKALQIYQKTLSVTDLRLANGYNDIGTVYQNMGEYSKALSYYEKALAIRQQSLPPNHLDLGVSYNNIGAAYQSIGDYSKALSYYEKALAIQQQSLSLNHPDLGDSYNNIGNVYHSMGEYSKALSSHEKALAIRQQSLPPNHPSLGMSYNNIGSVYYGMGDYPKALSYYEKDLEISQKSLPPNHPDLAMSYSNIGAVYRNMGEYSKALSSHERVLEIRQQLLPPNHPDLGASYNNIGMVYDSMGEYSKALSYYEKALEIKQQSLPLNHPDLASFYNNIGIVYRKMGDYSKALSSYEQALEVRQQSLPPNHPSLGMSYNNIGMLYENMGEYSKACSFYELAVENGQHSLPPNHPTLQQRRRNLEDVKNKL